MHTLYSHFISQIKREEIQAYNAKHRQYLIRSGKIDASEQRKPNQENQRRNVNKVIQNKQRKPRRQREFDRPSNTRRAAPIQQKKEDQYQTRRRREDEMNVEKRKNQYEEEQIEEQRPIKPATFSFDQELPNQRVHQPKAPIQSRPQQNGFKKTKPTTEIIKNAHEEKVIGKKPIQQLSEYQEAEVVLMECREGCGRKFNPQVLKKHEKVCQKVFQEKRKPFQIMKTNQEAEMLKKNDEKPGKKQKQDKAKKDKWQKNSKQFRNMLKRGRGEVVQEQVEDSRIPCPHCGRKFGQSAASRHIQFCKNKAKNKK